MTEPSLYIDFCPFEEAKNAQKQLLYFFTRGVVDYQGHLTLKDGCLEIQERVLKELHPEERRVYERVFELNNNYWHRMTECEKRIYALLVDTEKEISMDLLLTIIDAQYDPN